MSDKRPRVRPREDVLQKLQGRTAAANVQATIAHHPGLSRALGGLFQAVLGEGTTSRRQRELVILRTGWTCRSEYEFGQHTTFGLEAGLTEEEIGAITRDPATHPWSAQDAALLRMTDELHNRLDLTDETWERMETFWSTSQILEFVVTSLSYVMVSGILRTCRVQLDDGVPGWPANAATATPLQVDHCTGEGDRR